jgi:hypothetical protein
MTKREHEQFMVAKRAIEAVHRRLGIKREYVAREWQRDEKFLRESIWRKQVLRRQEAERIAIFEGWQHGSEVPSVEAEPPQEERRAS